MPNCEAQFHATYLVEFLAMRTTTSPPVLKKRKLRTLHEKIKPDNPVRDNAVRNLPVGAPRRNWKQTLVSDGYLIVRHPDLETTLEMADRVGTDLKIYAG